MPVIDETAKYYYVETPGDGVKLLKKSAAKSHTSYSEVPKPTATTIINEAKRYWIYRIYGQEPLRGAMTARVFYMQYSVHTAS